MTHDRTIQKWQAALSAAGMSAGTVKSYVSIVRRFLQHCDCPRLDMIPEDRARSFFAKMSPRTQQDYAVPVSRFLKFAAPAVPAVIDHKPKPAAPRIQDDKELALRQTWEVEKLTGERQKSDDLIALLARQVIDHYLFFQSRLKGEAENLDDIGRLADRCRHLIEDNLALFMKLSAEGRNVHSAIDEKVTR